MKMKIGIECEGEFKGQETVFVEAENVDDDFVTWLNVVSKSTAVYISDIDNILYLNSDRLYRMRPKRITIERTKFTEAPYYINIMLVIKNEHFWNLRGQDQIKFERDMNVYAIQKKSMPYTDPVEFKSDVEFDK